MKKLSLLFLIIPQVLLAQQPSKKDMQEYQKLMNDPEVKKYLNGKNVPDASTLQQQINFANQHTGHRQNAFPLKDAARIAALPRTVLTNEQFRTFLQRARVAVQKKISVENRNTATQFLKQMRTAADSNRLNYSAAAAVWMDKANPQVALYILSEAANLPGFDVNDVNNFAVLLTINGGEQLALPILQKINVEYPGNSTVLNNIGQAWFGLGEFNKAEKYIDSSLHFFAGNSEANYTKCYLELQKGNTGQATSYLLKSIQNGYDPAKEEKLNQLGKKLTMDDLGWSWPKPPDPIGIESILLFRPQDFYTDVNGQNSFRSEWETFEKQVSNAKQALVLPLQNAANNYALTFQKTMSNPSHVPYVTNFIQRKAGKMADLVTADFNDYMTRMGKEKLEIFKDVIPDELELNKKLGVIRDKVNNDPAKFCQAAAPLVDKFLAKYNPLVESYADNYIKHVKVYVGDMALLARYICQDDNVYNAYIYGLKAMLLDDLCSYPGRSIIPTAPVYYDLEPNCFEKKPLDIIMMGKLPDFDSVNCTTHISIVIPGVGSTHWDCNKETDEYDFGVGKISYKEDLNTGDYSAHAELKVSASKSIGKKGIFSGEISAGVGDFIEWNNKGVTDLGIIAEAGIEAGIDTEAEIGKDKYTVSKSGTVIGMDAKISFNSGPSLSGKGILSGVEIKNE